MDTYWYLGTSAVAAHGNSVNGFYIGLYGMLCILGSFGLTGGAYQLLLHMVPKSAEVLHERLLNTVMRAPLSFFTSTDTGTIINRFSQDMTVLDAELPYALVDLSLGVVVTMMGAVLMCLSAGYFAATMPPVILLVWGKAKQLQHSHLCDLLTRVQYYKSFICVQAGSCVFWTWKPKVPSILISSNRYKDW